MVLADDRRGNEFALQGMTLLQVENVKHFAAMQQFARHSS
jgi:hypothetical protein